MSNTPLKTDEAPDRGEPGPRSPDGVSRPRDASPGLPPGSPDARAPEIPRGNFDVRSALHLPGAVAQQVIINASDPPPPPFELRPAKRVGARSIVLASLALLLVGGGGLYVLRRPHVTVAAVERGTAVEAVYATGVVEAEERVTVKAKTSGAIDIRVKEGDRVKRGGLLAIIDARRLVAELEGKRAAERAANAKAGPDAPELALLEADSRAIEANLQSAIEDRDRMQKLVASGAAPQPDLDRLNSRITVFRRELDGNLARQRALRIDLSARASGSRAEVNSLQAALEDTEIRAPIDGVVLSRNVEPGETVATNQPLFRLGDTDHLILECTVDEADIGKVTVGKNVAVSLYAFPARVFKGEVFSILPDADRVKKTFLAKVRFVEAPPGLRSGMSGEANIVIEEHPNVLLIPSDAVDTAGNVAVVKDGRLERVSPKLGIRDMIRTEVLDGLDQGAVVVVAGGEGEALHTRVEASPRTATVEKAAGPPRGGTTL